MTAKARGYTLVEVLVAVLVFAVLSSSAYVALDGLSRAAMAHRQHSADLAALQMTVARMDADIRQLTTRAVMAGDGRRESALAGQRHGLTATRAGWTNPSGLDRGNLQRFSWQLTNNELVRVSWPVTDTVPGSQAIIDPVFSPLEELELRYRDGAGRWHEQWPAGAGAVETLPTAVEVRLVGSGIGAIRRLLVLEP
ncbi:MAG: type II secretion system minor pseudopilin GspJ [Wenzhouxiangella sp.]